MRVVLVAAMIVGCNQVYELQPTRLVDAAYFDAPTDAPFACPPPGLVPSFSPLVHQIAENCSQYTATIDGSRSVAVCVDETYTPTLMQREYEQPFAPIAELPGPAPSAPRLSPEGDELFVIAHPSTFSSSLEVYRRDVTNQWQHAYTVDTTLSLGGTVYIGAPSMGPRRRIMVSNYTGFRFELHELEIEAGTARVVHSYAPQELGRAPYYAPYLSPDGLRMYDTTPSQPMLYYARSDSDALFMSPLEVPTAPQVAESFMTADCARIYVHSDDLRSLFWVQQQ